MTKRVETTDWQQLGGILELWCDHRSIAITIYKNWTRTENNGFVTTCTREKREKKDAAIPLYEQLLQKLLDRIAKINTKQ